MSESTVAGSRTELPDNLEQVRKGLTVLYGLVPVVAGLDKFTNLLAQWPDYLPAAVAGALPVEAQTFMYAVGVVEILAGLVVFVYTEYGAYLVAAWLTGVALVMVAGGFLDIAVRDLVMAAGAVALAQLEAVATGN